MPNFEMAFSNAFKIICGNDFLFADFIVYYKSRFDLDLSIIYKTCFCIRQLFFLRKGK